VTTPSTPRLDEPVAPFTLHPAGDGDPVPVDRLVEDGPAVLALAEGGKDEQLQALLRELGERIPAPAARLILVSPGPSEACRAVEAVRSADWLTDPDGDAAGALGIVEQRKLRRARRKEGLFVLDRGRLLRFAFVVSEPGVWVPASFVHSRLSRLAAAAAAPAPAERADPVTLTEAGDMDELVRDIGMQLGLSGTRLTQLATASRFRDLGMSTVPDEIITKVEPLSDEEWEIVRAHPARSAEMLGPSPLFDQVRSIVRATHEHYDGSGYPDGLAADSIPLGARIILAAESYLALAMTGSDDPLDGLREDAGTRLDPAVVDALGAALAKRPAA
jgi:HD-GYP domain-containing protein (c-di-GMP phosphodiesterase class II)